MRWFDPRHAIRLIAPNGPTDILVCYSCFSIQTYDAHGMVRDSIRGVSNAEFTEVLLSSGLNIAR